MATQVLYNNINIFNGICPCPEFVPNTEFIYYGQRWAAISHVTLIGQITGKCVDGFADLVDKQNRLISGLGEDFHNLSIIENGTPIYDENYAVIKNVNFDQSRYVNLLNFQAEIDLYPPELFSGTFGCVNPSETWQFDEAENGIVNVTHEISAKGFNTSTQALQNAKDYVLARTGWNNQINPSFIQKCYSGGWNLCPQTFNESINRLTAEYKVTENFVSDIYNSGVGIVRYSTTLDSGIENGITTVSVQGNLDYCRNGTLSGMRARYKSIDLYSIAVNAYRAGSSLINLNPYYLTSGVEEDSQNLLLNFSASFDNDTSPIVSVDYKVDLNTNELSEITAVQLDARIFSRGSLAARYPRVLNYYDNNFFPYYLANTQYQNAGYPYLLNVQPISENISKNPLAGEINYSATWSDKLPIPSGLKDLNYTVQVTPPIKQFSNRPSLFCNGTYFVYDLGYVNREKVEVQGQATVSKNNTIESGVLIVSNYVQAVKNKYAPGNWDSNRVIIEDNQLTTGDPANHYISFIAAWSRNGTEVTF